MNTRYEDVLYNVHVHVYRTTCMKQLCVCVQGVVERLQMADPSPSLVQCQLGRNSGLFSKLQATETSNLSYLAHCYARACEESKRESKVSEEEMR